MHLLLGEATELFGQVDDSLLRQQSHERWQPEVQRLLQLDQTESYPDDAVLFIGSSSIRLWDTIADDMAPWVPIRRGFGGSKTLDVAVVAPQLIQSHQYAALVIFVANDISGEAENSDVDPEQVANWMLEILDVSRRHRPTAPIVIIEITPTARRWHVWDKQRRLNHRLRELALTQPHTYFLPTAEYFLTATGEVRSELFVADQLHLNAAGYELWSQLLRRRLDELLNH